MAIDTICGGCQKKLRVDDEHAGKKARCPHCGWVYEVPAVGSQPTSSASEPFGGSLPSGASVAGPASTAGSAAGQDSNEWFLQTEDGQVYGPVPKSEMDDWVREGRVTDRSRLRSSRAAAWVLAGEIYPQLSKPVSGGIGSGASPNPFAEQNPFTAPSAAASSAYPSAPTRRYLQPHRGGTILTLGILGIFCCGIAAIVAWVMGQQDLNAMNQGRMDPSGRGTTQVGMILGIIGTILMAGGILINIIGAMADM